jgi:hypothetical protein
MIARLNENFWRKPRNKNIGSGKRILLERINMYARNFMFLALFLGISSDVFACPGAGSIDLYLEDGSKIGYVDTYGGKVSLEEGYTLRTLHGDNLDPRYICLEPSTTSTPMCSKLQGDDGAYLIPEEDRITYMALDIEIFLPNTNEGGKTAHFTSYQVDLRDDQPRKRGGCGDEITGAIY